MMGRQKYLGAFQRSDSDILAKIIVVADEDSDAAALGSFEDSVFRSGSYVFADEAVKLPVTLALCIGHSHDIGVVERAVLRDLY